MTYSETIGFLYSRLPFFTRDGAKAVKKNLDNTIALCEHLGNPQNNFKSIHIAGTNGKGSVSHMLHAILMQHQKSTGLYTSPHLRDFRERIKVNGQEASEKFVIDFVERNLEFIEEIKPSFFELTVGMAFQYFAEQNIEYAVVETGLGGRLDSTNILKPILSVITNIGMDHMDMLGDTLEKIAFEKAGIIKHKTPVVIGESSLISDPIFLEKANESQSQIYFADKNIKYYNTEIESDLKGIYQQQNISTVLQACEVLHTIKNPELDDFLTASALMNVIGLTGFHGRWEIIHSKPRVIVDTAHNAHGMKFVMQQLKAEKYKTLRIIIGMMSDKDRAPILEMLPKDAIYYFTRPDLPRALKSEELQKEAAVWGLLGNSYSSVAEAYQQALQEADKDDVIFAGGSTFVVAEMV